MPQDLPDTKDIDSRIADAVVQLREQQAIVSRIDCERHDQAVLLRLLSSVLVQFHRLKSHRRTIMQRF